MFKGPNNLFARLWLEKNGSGLIRDVLNGFQIIPMHKQLQPRHLQHPTLRERQRFLDPKMHLTGGIAYAQIAPTFASTYYSTIPHDSLTNCPSQRLRAARLESPPDTPPRNPSRISRACTASATRPLGAVLRARKESLAIVLAEAYLEKFGCDTLPEMLERLEEYKKFIAMY
jgi:hypothetical protein